MALPFEEQEGLPFEASGLPFEAEETKPQIPSEQLGQMPWYSRAISGAVGGPEAMLSMASAVPAYVAGGARGLYGLATGEGMEEAGKQAEEVIHATTYEPRSVAGKVFTQEALGPAFEKAMEFGGEAVTQVGGEIGAQFFGQEARQDVIEEIEPLTRTLGERGLEAGVFIGPMAGAKAGIKAGRQRQAELSKAQEILQKSQEAEAQIRGQEEAGKAYIEAYEQLDNLMMRYPKDYQAPQLGLGGKVARIPDQVRAEKQARVDQQAFDADMARIAENEATRAAQMAEQVRFSEARGPAVSTVGPRKPHVVGPQATVRDVYSDPAAAAAEVRAKMESAKNDAVRIAPDQIKPVGAIDAYHGSPFKFQKFELQKIGSGEGAQAYGWGLYFAESNKVAKEYQRILTEKYKADISQLEARLYNLKSLLDPNSNTPFLLKQKVDRAKIIVEIKQLQTELNQLKSSGQDKGSLYKVALDITERNTGDWDKSFHQQSPEIQKGLQQLTTLEPSLPKDWISQASEIYGPTLGGLYRALSDRFPKATVSQLLNQVGIKGLKYLDQVSRQVGKGTYNYVMFDDALIKIKSVGAQERKVPGFNPKLHELQTGLRWNNERGYFEEIPSTPRMQLEAIRDHSEIPVFKEIAKLLLADKEFNPKFEIKSLEAIRTGTGMASDAAFNPRTYTIELPLKTTGKEALTLHEFVHAATYGAIETHRASRTGGYYGGAALEGPLRKPVQRLQDLFNYFLDDYRAQSKEPILPYGLTNIHEFIAEGFTNPEFQALLARTKLPKQLRKGLISNYWDSFVEAIGKLLGFDGFKHNYLSELIRTGADIVQGADSELRRYFDTSPDAQRGREALRLLGGFELKDFKQQLKDQGVKLPESVIQAMWEGRQKPAPEPKSHPTEGVATSAAIKFQREYADRRTLEEMAAELKNVKEDTLVDQASYNTVGKILQGRFIAHGNPLLSWVSSKAHWVKQKATERANRFMHGDSRKNPSPGTYNYLWKTFDKQTKIAVNDLGQALQGEAVWLGEAGVQAKAREVLGRELTRNEMQSYLDRTRINKQVLAEFNQLLAKEGKESIAELPHYWSPAVHQGPFLAKFIDKAGNTVKTESFYRRPNESKLQKVAPDFKVEIVEKDVRADVDFREFEAVLRQLSKEQRDPAAKAIAEGIRRMGFRKHGLKRKGVKGARGTEGGIEGVRNYEEVSERYIRQAYDFMANRELDTIFNQVRDLKEANHLPHTKTWALEAIDAARGGSNKTFDALSRDLSAAISGTIAIGTGGKLRLPQRFTRDLLRQGNKVKTTLLLGFFNPIHIGAQLLQAPTFMPPKLLAMAAEAGINPVKIMNVMARSLGEYSKWNKSKDAAMLEKIGAFDATFKYDWSTYAGDSSPHYKRSLYDHATGLSTLMWVESHAVRRPAAHMFLEMLREIGYDKIAKDKMEIYKVAREMTDHYMVSMRFYEKPHVFSRTGLAGMAFSPLKSFATTWLGMLREYTKLSASGLLEGSVAKSTPIAAFLAANLLTAGMLGFVGIKEWDVLAKLINEYTNFNVPSGTEWVASKFKSKGMRYGLLSEALPWDISVGPTFTGPSLAESYFWSAPGLGLYADAAKFAATGIAATGAFGESNVPGPAAQREAMKGMAPRFSPLPGYNWGDIEKIMTPEGQPYAEASGKAGPVTRTPEDWRARRLGTYTTREREEKLRFYEAQKRVKTMGKQVSRAVDIILSNKGMDKLPELWKELGEKNFSAQEIQTALKREIYDRLIESDIRALGTSMSPKQQRLWMLYQTLEGAGTQGAFSGQQ